MIESYRVILGRRFNTASYRYLPYIFIIAGDYNTRSFSSVILDERADETEFIAPKVSKKFKKKLAKYEKHKKKIKKKGISRARSDLR